MPRKLRIGFALLVCAVTLATAASCRRAPTIGDEAAELGLASASFYALADDLSQILSDKSITNMRQLRVEYARRFPGYPPLFTNVSLAPRIGREDGRQLPLRSYFWLKEWSTNDPPATPLFWSFFHIPDTVVRYLALDGSEHVCSSNELYPWLNAISIRSELATPSLTALRQ